jgi:hypothetical protein
LLLSENFTEIATFIGVGLFAKLSVGILSAVASTFKYVRAFGLMEVATLGASAAVGTLNKRLSLLGGAWGVALFGAIELVSWLMESNSEIDVFSDTYKEAMDSVKKATEDGFGTDDIPTFNDAIRTSIEEVKNLREEILRLEQTNAQRESLKGNYGIGVRPAEARGLDIAIDSGIGMNEAKITAIKEKYEELERAFEDNISALKRVDDGFGFLNETLARFSFNIEKSGQAQGIFTTALGLVRQGAQSLIDTQENANTAIEEWTVKAQKQNDELQKQIATFGQSREEILLYEASLIDTTGATTAFKKIHSEMVGTLKASVKELQRLKKAEKERSEFLKQEKKRLQDLERERQTRLEQFKKDFQAAQDQVDPMGALMTEYAQKMTTAFGAFADGSITVFELQEALEALAIQYEDNIEKQERSTNSFEKLVAEIDNEIAITEALGDKKLELLAIRDLENAGLEVTSERIEELITKYKRLAKAQGNGGAFGGGNSDIGTLFGQAFGAIGGDGAGFFGTLSNGFSEMFSSSEQFADGIGSIGGAISTVLNTWSGTEGQDSAGRLLETATAIIGMIPGWGQAIAAVANIVNSISGGKLFGTAFETTGGLSNISIDGSGGSGFVQTFRERERSFFRGTERDTITDDLSGDAQAAVAELFASIGTGMEAAASALGVDMIEMISGSFTQEFDKDGNLTREFVEMLGRTFEEGFDQFGSRIFAENLIAIIDSALPQVERTFTQRRSLGFDRETGLGDIWIETEVTQMVGQATTIAERWRNNAEMLLEGSQFLLVASQRFVNGESIFASLEAATDFVELNSQANETLTDTFQRVIAAESLFSQSIDRMGITFGLLGEEFIQYSVDFVEAAGGLERAGELLGGYFDNFYTTQENNVFRLNSLLDSATSELSDIGLDPSVGMAEFREMLEGQINDLAPEDLTQWLEAGNALANLNTEIERLVALEGEYNDFIVGFRAGLVELSGTEFSVGMAQLDIQFQQNVDRANELAQAAGRAGASVEDLAVIQEAYARQTELITAQLRNQVLSLIDQLYGEDLDNQIAQLESQQSNAINNVGNSALSMWEAQLRAVESISNVIDSLLINEQLSPLSRTDQFNEAYAQFQEMLAAAQGGDVDAMEALPGMATTLLQIGRDVFASGSDYNAIFDTVIAGLQSIGVTLNEPSTVNSNVTVSVSSELQALYEQREARDQALYAQQRMELAQQLAVHLNDLAGFVNQPVLELASSLGVNMTALVTDLGVNMTDLTVATTLQLSNIANMLGVNMVELANSLGDNVATNLGLLAQQQSLMNDAVEARIAELPEASANFLTPFLRAIENATNDTDANQAIADMEAAINTLPPDQANLLAPFFENIEYQSEFDQQLALLQAQRDAVISSDEYLRRIINESTEQGTALDTVVARHNTQISILGSIDDGIDDMLDALNSGGSGSGSGSGSGGGNTNNTPNLPQFAKGVRKLKSDQVAQLHAGETVLPATVVKAMEDFGIPVAGNQSNGEVVAHLSRLTATIQNQNRVLEGALNKLVDSVKSSSKDNASTISDALNNQARSNYR